MAWRDELREASFRNVAFFVQSADGEIGRRSVIHDIPGREDPVTEDLGKLAKTFSLEMIVVGEEYHLQRDALIDALEVPGPGILIHPYRGELKVVVSGRPTVRESTREGGSARLSVTFIEAGKVSPAETKDTSQAVASAAALVNANATRILTDNLQVRGQQDWIATRAFEDFTDCVDALRAANGRVSATIAGVNAVSAEIDDFALQGTRLLMAPADLATALLGVVVSVYSAVTTLGNAAASVLRLMTSDAGESGDVEAVPSADLVVDARNRQALRFAQQATCLAAACEAAVEVEYEAAEDAADVRGDLFDAIDALLPFADTDAYAALVDLRASTVAFLDAAAARLPTLTTVTLTDDTPALVLAWNLYGDPERGEEITRRNRLPDPSSIPAGSYLVLSE